MKLKPPAWGTVKLHPDVFAKILGYFKDEGDTVNNALRRILGLPEQPVDGRGRRVGQAPKKPRK